MRRRFSFFNLEPGFDSEGFISYQESLNSETLNELISRIKELNYEIANDKTLGKGFCIGHSYFCSRDICTDEWLREVVEYDILPMLDEYWFDDASRLQSGKTYSVVSFNDKRQEHSDKEHLLHALICFPDSESRRIRKHCHRGV